MADYLVEDTVKCDECGSRNLNRDETRGEVVCEDCGLVLEDKESIKAQNGAFSVQNKGIRGHVPGLQ